MKGTSKGFLTKTDRGPLTKKAGKSRKTQLVCMKGNMSLRRGEAVADVLSCITLLLLMS